MIQIAMLVLASMLFDGTMPPPVSPTKPKPSTLFEGTVPPPVNPPRPVPCSTCHR